MGNTESNVTSGVKKQAGVSTQALYKFVNLKGGGLLVDMMKRAIQNKQYAEIDHAIKTKVEPFLYNKGKGKYVPVSVLVLLRNRERPRHKQLPEIRAMENPEEDFDMDAVCPEVSEAEYYMNPSGYREVCWNVKERGAVGETILHLCLLNATSLHADLAKRLLRFYPKLINDVYMCDEYYGESVLHLAIVNEDPAMVKYLLDHNSDVNERCCGTFMCPEDQKASRCDTVETEIVQMVQMTNYDGYVYWGEYPLSFAACLGQEECYRLVLARGADPDNKDFNGNTVLHMLVIYEKITTFDMGYEVGSSLSIRNNQNLTPLTLAAKLGRVEMFFHIMNIEREIYWQLGSITCAAYPLVLIDTIDVETGNISKDSALNLVVFGDKDEHLDLLDGVLIDLLKTKWNTFVKDKFYRQFFMFFCYFCVSLVSFTLRNGPPPAEDDEQDGSEGGNKTTSTKEDLRRPLWNESSLGSNGSVGLEMFVGKLTDLPQFNGSAEESPEFDPSALDDGLFFNSKCHTMDYDGMEGKVRLISEMIILVGSFLYLLAALRELKFLGRKMFFENLMTAPSRVMFLFSCCIMMIVPFLKVLCFTEMEDHVAVAIMLTTAPYFLFFCRGFKTVGPFVVMIYRMVMGDLLRFVVIYLVFVMGFSQAYYIVFLSYKPEEDGDANPMPSPIESIVAMFLMSLTNFGDYYGALENTDHEMCAKILFVLFMVIVAVLLVNMLIAMMGNTYQKIAETKNEWQRQWARIVLVVERGVPPKERLKNLMSYSQPMSDGRRALVLRLNMTDEDKEEMKEILEMKRVHDRLNKKRQVERDARAEQRRLLREKYMNMSS
ncbi:transient receptor potential cation channel subfamily V member 5 [Anopheles marshallii]|uniref:transient receptor potential cation channel subfamily V member 5 n=1 Tax=Anopheles marshallii TaxID=1521116 RepID=UPI00237ACBBB|nr:transient receptor potential cation channel subfamily V member 5 [Anopheles marshallii]